jgi:DNA-binding XRE family transcriptional regulator
MKFNYSKLLGRIKECGYTQEKLAEAIQINKGTLNQKLKNKSHFTTLELSKMCKTLSISPAEIGEYFFAE